MSEYLKVKISRMYYLSDISKTEIGQHLGISRFRVSRLLEQAREDGIVQIQINEPTATHTEVEQQLEKRFNLRLAVVVDSGDPTDQGIMRAIGAAAANHLENLLGDGDVLGVTWGATVNEAVKALPSKIERRLQVVQMVGGLNQSAIDINPIDLVRRVAEIYDAPVYVLYAPTMVGNPATRNAMLQDSSFQETIKMFDRITVALSGIGAFSTHGVSNLLKAGYIQNEDLIRLRDRKAVGDIFGHFFNIYGEACDAELEQRTLGMGLEQLKKVRHSIGVAGGAQKSLAILGALRGGLINTLVTNLATAVDILEKDTIFSK